MTWMQFAILETTALLIPIFCGIVAFFSCRYYDRWVFREMYRRENLLTEKAENLRNKEQSLRDREESAAELGRRIKSVSTTMRAETERFDTMVSLADWDDLPNPHENADTVQMPAVKEWQ